MKEDEIDRVLAEFMMGEELSGNDYSLLEEWRRRAGRNEWFEGELTELRNSGRNLKVRKDKRVVFAEVEKIVEKQRKKQGFIRWSSVAAGIIIVLGFVGYWGIEWDRSEEKQAVLARVNHGEPKAELILPQGEVVQLDTSSREILFSNNQVKVRSIGNALVYDSVSSSAIVEFHTVRVPTGAEFSLRLSDNTQVYLNSGSSLRYPVRFTGDVREVFLTGEGYFEVTKDVERAFVVKVGEMDVRVLGTSFNVSAYPEDKVVETTLVEGKVRVEYKDKERILNPGMQLKFDRVKGEMDVRVVDTEVYTSWKDGYYYFKRESLERIMVMLSRWYNLNVFFQNSDLKDMEFGGRLKRYEDITYLLKKMEETRDVKFEINGNTIIIKRKTD